MDREVTKMGSIGLVVPLFKSWTHIEAVANYVNLLKDEIGGFVTITFVVDGCSESEFAIRENIYLFSCPVQLVVLSRNFGVGPALRAAMSVQSEDFTIAFGSDLQEPRDLFVKFANDLRTNQFDFVFGQRVNRDDPLLSRYFSGMFWSLNRRFVFPDCPPGGFDVYGCNEVARLTLVQLEEHRTNITSQMLWIGLRRKFVAFDRASRTDGKSTWSFRKKLGLFVDSFVAFTSKPLKLGTAMSFLLPFFVVGATLDTKWSLGLWLISSVLWTLSCFLILPYIVRHLDGNRHRPTFVIRSVETLRD
jgi:hypothetical protein